ncbi:hypothetical protein [Sphingomonas bacterium]|uniref:hypothetical protein n=1 Tax=Sphingomonas bacterium TaxID=1895847 RepID=UPI001575910D|nr:hypothetical protein [Sphingomonas bacterium]
MARAWISGDGGVFQWDLDANVGRNCPNRVEDVELVRFGYTCMKSAADLTAQQQSTLAAMKNSGGYGPDLQAVIDAHESARGGAQDGRVSQLPKALTLTAYDGQHMQILVALNANMRADDKANYPRIDKAAASGPVISAKSRSLFRIK